MYKMKRTAAAALCAAMMISLAACSGGEAEVTPDPGTATPTAAPEATAHPMSEPESSTAAELYERFGVYLYTVNEAEEPSWLLQDDIVTGQTTGGMSFTVDGREINFRIRRADSYDAASGAQLSGCFGPWETEATPTISRQDALLRFNEGGEGYVFWQDRVAGLDCCVFMPSGADADTLCLYGNLLYASVHSEAVPDPDEAAEPVMTLYESPLGYSISYDPKRFTLSADGSSDTFSSVYNDSSRPNIYLSISLRDDMSAEELEKGLVLQSGRDDCISGDMTIGAENYPVRMVSYFTGDGAEDPAFEFYILERGGGCLLIEAGIYPEAVKGYGAQLLEMISGFRLDEDVCRSETNPAGG